MAPHDHWRKIENWGPKWNRLGRWLGQQKSGPESRRAFLLVQQRGWCYFKLQHVVSACKEVVESARWELVTDVWILEGGPCWTWTDKVPLLRHMWGGHIWKDEWMTGHVTLDFDCLQVRNPLLWVCLSLSSELLDKFRVLSILTDAFTLSFEGYMLE